jgi:hypothetical protein
MLTTSAFLSRHTMNGLFSYLVNKTVAQVPED